MADAQQVRCWALLYLSSREQRPLFDWYVGGEQLWPTLKTLLSPEAEILEIGCGNSPLAEYLYAFHGFRKLQCVDFSAPCIEQMQKRAQEQNMKITYRTMDVRCVGYTDATFDVVLDKVRKNAGPVSNAHCVNPLYRLVLMHSSIMVPTSTVQSLAR